MVTLILTLTMCALLFLMIWAATYFYPWTGLLRFFPKDIEEKARLQRADFTDGPEVTLIYGTDETLYACAPAIEAALEKGGVSPEMIVGEGLFHCYPVFPIVKEGKEGWRQMVERMIQWREET